MRGGMFCKKNKHLSSPQNSEGGEGKKEKLEEKRFKILSEIT